MYKSGRIRMWSVAHSYVWHAWFIRMICLIHMYDMTRSYLNKTHSYLCHDWFIPPEKLLGNGFSTPMPLFCLIFTIISNKTCTWIKTRKPILSQPGSILVDGFNTRLIPRGFSCDAWHDSVMCAPWLISMFDVPHSNVWIPLSRKILWCNYSRQDTCKCVAWLVRWSDSVFVKCAIPHVYVFHVSCLCVAKLIHMPALIWQNSLQRLMYMYVRAFIYVYIYTYMRIHIGVYRL